MGLPIEEDAYVLPADWREAIRAIEAAASSVNIQYAVVGSLGVAVSLGLPWGPLKPVVAGRERRPRDLDVFLVGGANQRAQFDACLHAIRQSALPVVDVVPFYHAFTEFDAGQAILHYRTVRVPVHAGLFTPVRIQRDGVAIPVLHPRVQRHLIEMLPTILPKGQNSVRLLSAGLTADLARFPAVAEDDCLPFRAFRAERRRRYPLREWLLSFRMTLWGWEEEARRSPLVAMKVHIRKHHPSVAKMLQRLFG